MTSVANKEVGFLATRQWAAAMIVEKNRVDEIAGGQYNRGFPPAMLARRVYSVFSVMSSDIFEGTVDGCVRIFGTQTDAVRRPDPQRRTHQLRATRPVADQYC
jgi:hypothetical protein